MTSVLHPILVSLGLTIALLLAVAPARGEDVRVLFTGDVLLSRQVEVEISRTGRSPWDRLATELAGADLVIGNLEGAVGAAADCLPSANPCFAVAPNRIALLRKAGFTAMTIENNHSDDLGEAGRNATVRTLRTEAIRPIDLEHGPSFFRAGGVTIAVVAVNLIGRHAAQIPSPEIRRQLRLASRLAQVVVVSVHWGEELLDWPSIRQEEAARWLVANGASVVMGHHPHVVQPPQCVDGRPVFFSLGNHLFDQKYPETKEGLIADCRISISNAVMTCGAFTTKTAAGSFSPVMGERSAATLSGCPVPLNPLLRLGETTLRPASSVDAASMVLEASRSGNVVARTRPAWLLSAEAALFDGSGKPPLLFTLERHPSSIDGEEGVRPYVYEVGPRGLIARWRGSALAWPLVDATTLPGNSSVLCALHRNDSFLTLDSTSRAGRAALYRWTGFGFKGFDDAAALAACRALWGIRSSVPDSR